ncbi:MAG: hypothetical protein HXY39_00470 [Chloroflexi bacterium]|nr:hypothetical protein [Chloroflexota bacterium]
MIPLVHLTEALALELAPEARIYALAPDLIAENEDMDPAFVPTRLPAHLGVASSGAMRSPKVCACCVRRRSPWQPGTQSFLTTGGAYHVSRLAHDGWRA